MGRQGVKKRVLLLIDGHNLFYRAIHAPGPRLTAPDGELTSGTFFFTKMLLATLRDRAPTHVAVAIDGPRKMLERRKIDPAYKANRNAGQETPAEIIVQVARMKEVVVALGLTVVKSKGWEADDVIATLVRRYSPEVDHTEIVSRDRDLHQLVSDKRCVSIFDPQSRGVVRLAEVKEHWGVMPKQVVEMKTLMGDPGDNVKGAKGIGPVKARALIQEYGTAENVKANVERLPFAVRGCILPFDVARGRQLVGLNSEAPLVPEMDSIEHLSYSRPDLAGAQPLFDQLGFRRITSY